MLIKSTTNCFKSVMIAFIMCLASISSFASSVIPEELNTPKLFVENSGQWAPEIKFRAEIPNGFIFFRESGISYFFYETTENEAHSHASGFPSVHSTPPLNESLRGHGVHVEYKNCDSNKASLTGINAGSAYSNFFIGSDPANWVSKVRSYSELLYHDIYPGISIKYYVKDDYMKYDVLVEPNADPTQVIFVLEGHDGLNINEGNLQILTSIQNISEQKPYTFQHVSGAQKEVTSSFDISSNEVRFQFPEGYDRSKPLIIDPQLVFSTFSGVTADNWGFTASFDSKGNTYSAGIARIEYGGRVVPSAGAIQIEFGGGTWDIALFKYDSTGSNLLYATYLGGSDAEVPHSLVVNENDELHILGSTSSSDFPTSTTAYNKNFSGGTYITPMGGVPYVNGSDIFVTRISEDGTQILGSTFVGGSGNDGVSTIVEYSDPLIASYGDQIRGDIITDIDNNIYIASSTASTDFPTVNGLYQSHAGGNRDAVVMKLSPTLDQIIWSTYLGGEEEDAAVSIKLDAENNVLVAGSTGSSNFPSTTTSLNPTFKGNVDGFASLLAQNGQTLLGSTYIGTDAHDLVYFADFDTEGDIYLLGQSQGNYPITDGVYSNPNSGQFIQKLSANLEESLFSTVFGSGNSGRDISPTAFLVNECNNLFVAGWASNSSLFGRFSGYDNMNAFNLPITQNSFQSTTNGSDFYLSVFTANMEQLLYATYMGGTTAVPHVDGGTSRFDKRGVVYQSVCTCGGARDDFPTTDGAYSNTNNAFPAGGVGPRCNNAVFKFDLATLDARIETSNIDGTNVGIDKVCLGIPILFTNRSSGGEIFLWDFGDGNISTAQDSIPYIYEAPGIYDVILRVEDKNTCQALDSAFTTVLVFDHEVVIMDDAAICEGIDIQLSGTGAARYSWTAENSVRPLTGDSPSVTPDTSIKYFVEATTAEGCVIIDSVLIEVTPSYDFTFTVDKQLPCTDELPEFILTTTNELDVDVIWDLGDQSSSTEKESFAHKYTSSGIYNVELKLQNDNGCSPAYNTNIQVYGSNVQIMKDASICEGTEIELTATGAESYQWNIINNGVTLIDDSPVVIPEVTTQYSLIATTQDGCMVEKSVLITVTPSFDLDFDIQKNISCTELPTFTFTNTSNVDRGLIWDFGDGQSETAVDINHSYATEGNFIVNLAFEDTRCTNPVSHEISNQRITVPNIFSPNKDSYNEYFEILNAEQVEITIVDRSGGEVFSSDDYQNDWNAEGLPDGTYYYNLFISETGNCKGWVQVIR